MGIKRIISAIVLSLCVISLSYSQEYVKIKKDYNTMEYDDNISGGSVEYFGWSAYPGATESESVWKIMKITYSGADFIIQWADGTQNYSYKWEERATLTYQ